MEKLTLELKDLKYISWGGIDDEKRFNRLRQTC